MTRDAVKTRPGVVAWLATLLFISSLGTAAGGPPASRPNIVFITIDTLRADHLGCYGYKQIQTPSIDALASQSARFTQAHTPVPITLPAHTAIFTGSFPMATGMHDFSGNKLPASVPTLAKVLHDNGYTTAAFLGSAVLDSRFGLNQGFDTYFDHFDFSRLDEAYLDQMERRGDQVMDEALGWLKRNPRQPFFLWVHLYDPHAPYTPPEPFLSRYKSRPYDGEIAFADSQVGRLITFLNEIGAFSDALMVLSGDHGEGLGEHGEATHGFFIYESTLRVPLLIKIPGAAPRSVSEEVSLVDIMPTLLSALRISVPDSVQGRSVLNAILGRPSANSSNLYSENYLPLLHFHWSQLRGVEVRGLKYIEAPRPELYDLRTDARESRNLFQTRQADAHELHDQLFTLLRRYTPSTGGGPREKEPTDPALAERLRSLGYVAISAGSFSDAGGKPLPDPKDRIQVYELVSDAMSDGQHGRYDESLRKLQEAEKTEPNSIPIHYLMALDYYRIKEFTQATQAFRKVLELDSKFSLASYYLGLCYTQVGNFQAAAESFEHALDLDPTNFLAAFSLGAAYSRLQRADDALDGFLRALAINPNYAEAYEAAGEIYLYQKKVDEAIRSLEHATSLAPNMQKAHHNLGRAYEAKGLHDKAQHEFSLAKRPD